MGRIIIDCGHGGQVQNGGSSASGVVGRGGLAEKDVTFDLGSRVAALLGGAILTRGRDNNPSLAQRASLAARHRATALVSLHANEGPPGARGSETWIHTRADDASHRLGVLSGDLALLTPERLPDGTAACLVEVDYLSDPHGERRLRDPRERDALARAIADGIRAWGSGLDVHAPPRRRAPARALADRCCVGTFNVPIAAESHSDPAGPGLRRAGVRFRMDVDFTTGGDCRCECGEYRHFVRGTFTLNGRPVTHLLPNPAGGARPMLPRPAPGAAVDNFQEDGAIVAGVNMFPGHRTLPQAGPNDPYLPDRATGCRYRGKDYPSMTGRVGVDTFTMDLDFRGTVIDVCNSDAVTNSNEWPAFETGAF
jgi:hypothetical protein